MFSHEKFSEFCIIDYDNNFGNGIDACVPPSMTPTRLFYETQVLECDDYMSRLFLAINTTNATDPEVWNNKDLAENEANCQRLAEESTQPLVQYMASTKQVFSTPSVLGIPAFRSSQSNSKGLPPCMLPASTVVTLPSMPNTPMTALRNDTSCELYLPAVAGVMPTTVIVKNPGVWASGLSDDDWELPVQLDTFNYSTMSTSTDCPLLKKEHVDNVNDYLMLMLAKKDLGDIVGNLGGEDIFGFFMSADTLDKGYTTRSRMYYSLGAPLSPYLDEADRPAEQRSKYMKFLSQVETIYMKRFGMETGTFPSSMPRSAYRTSAIENGVKFQFYGLVVFNKEFERMMNGDLPMVSLAVLFVFGYLTFHTQSLFLACNALYQILLSLPVSYTVYRYVWGIPFFSQLHILAIFLVLGVGADDVFVLADAWKESAITVARKEVTGRMKGRTKEEQAKATREYQRKRMQFAYGRTAIAVFNTSFTTAMAFVSTGISPIMSIATFGWFAATCIITNYVLTVTWYPSVIMVKEMYVDPWYERRCGCACRSKKKTTIVVDATSKVTSKVAAPPPPKLGGVARCFRDCYVPTMTYRTKKGNIPIVALSIVIVLTAYAAQAAYFTTLLTPPTKSEQFFPADHMFTGVQERMTDNYMGGADSSYTNMGFMFGAIPKELDRTSFDQYFPDVNRGVIKWDDDFDIYPKENQDSLVQFCQMLETHVCMDVLDEKKKLSGCTTTGNKLVRPGTMECFMTEFQEWHREQYEGVETWNIGTRELFEERLFEFRKITKPKNNDITGSWKTQIGFVNKKLKFVRITFLSSMELLSGPITKKPVYDMTKKMCDDHVATAPKGLQNVFPEGPLFGFVWMTTQVGFVNGLLMGLGICFPIAFLVLWFATGNIILAVYATFAIGSVVCSVLGFCQAVMGWDLGVAESIAGIIVIGFSVDYVVHMAHMYTEAEENTGAKSRDERFAYAAEKMGLTIIGGAVTTAGSGSMMFLCQMVFFFKMGFLVCMTILFSVIYSLGFFMALCVLIGPEGDVGNTGVMIRRCCGGGCCGGGKTVEANQSSRAGEKVGSGETKEQEDVRHSNAVEMTYVNEQFKHKELSTKEILSWGAKDENKV